MTDILIMFLKCLALGFSIAMILGPIGILCIQQTLANGFRAGFAVGLGASTADGFFAAIAGIGLCFIINILLGYQFLLNLLGGIFLLYLGIRTLLRKPPTQNIDLKAKNLMGLYGSTILLTITNPITIISFSALLAGVNITNPGVPTLIYAALLFFSFFIGSTLWWLLLSSTLSMFRNRVKPILLERINTIAGVLLLCFGIIALIRAFVIY